MVLEGWGCAGLGELFVLLPSADSRSREHDEGDEINRCRIEESETATKELNAAEKAIIGTVARRTPQKQLYDFLERDSDLFLCCIWALSSGVVSLVSMQNRFKVVCGPLKAPLSCLTVASTADAICAFLHLALGSGPTWTQKLSSVAQCLCEALTHESVITSGYGGQFTLRVPSLRWQNGVSFSILYFGTYRVISSYISGRISGGMTGTNSDPKSTPLFAKFAKTMISGVVGHLLATAFLASLEKELVITYTQELVVGIEQQANTLAVTSSEQQLDPVLKEALFQFLVGGCVMWLRRSIQYSFVAPAKMKQPKS